MGSLFFKILLYCSIGTLFLSVSTPGRYLGFNFIFRRRKVSHFQSWINKNAATWKKQMNIKILMCHYISGFWLEIWLNEAAKIRNAIVIFINFIISAIRFSTLTLWWVLTESLLDKINSELKGWKTRLSQARRLTSIKSVINSLPLYIPLHASEAVCNEMDRTICKFGGSW